MSRQQAAGAAMDTKDTRDTRDRRDVRAAGAAGDAEDARDKRGTRHTRGKSNARDNTRDMSRVLHDNLTHAYCCCSCAYTRIDLVLGA